MSVYHIQLNLCNLIQQVFYLCFSPPLIIFYYFLNGYNFADDEFFLANFSTLFFNEMKNLIKKYYKFGGKN